MELVLIRHTKVDVPAGICYGRSDVDVAVTFKEEAAMVKTNLGDQPFDVVWASPLQRCRKLAEYLFPEQAIRYDERLREFDFGDWEGMTWDAIFQLPEGKHWMDNFVHQRTPNGDSFVDQAERVKQFYLEKEAEFFGQRMAIVAHAGTIRSLLCYLKGIALEDAFKMGVDYGEIIEI